MCTFLENHPKGCLLVGSAGVGLLAWMASGTTASIGLLVLLLLGPAVEDARSGYISDGWSVLLVISGMVTSGQENHLVDSFCTAVGLLLLYGLLFLLHREGVGMGDVLLSLAISVWLTPIFGLVFLWLAAVTALFYAGCYRWLVSKTKVAGVRFGPFLALGGGIAYGLQETGGLSWLFPFWLYFG